MNVSSDLQGDEVMHAGPPLKFPSEDRRKRHDINGNGHGDPAPDPVDLAADRAHQLVGNIATHALDELRKARDEIDTLMRGIQARQDALANDIVGLAQFAADAIAAKVVISDGIVRLSDRIRPRTGPTITQRAE